MILINISSDSVWLFRDWKSIFVPKSEVIETFHHKLFNIVQDNNISQCFVISWPGSFTTLRATALVINTLISTKTWTPTLYQLDKISFFDIFVQNQLLPLTWIINIWQKNNMRQINYDCHSCEGRNPVEKDTTILNYTKSTISKKTISDQLWEKTSKEGFFIEWLYEEELWDEELSKKNFLITSIDDCSFENKEWTLNYNYNWQISQIPFFDFKRKNVELVVPEYMIEAVR